MFAVAGICLAQDLVVEATGEDGSGRVNRKGMIVDYTGRGVRLESTTGVRKTIPLERVVRIEFARCDAHRAAAAAMAAGDFSKAMEHFTSITSTNERRGWVRTLIVANIIQCQQALGNYDAACHYFLGLLRNDKQTPHFDVIPLAWLSSQQLSDRRAEGWLVDELPPARLLAASYLLPTAYRDKAVAKLQKLTGSEDPRIAQLAAAQLWRTRVANASPDEVAQWSRKIEEMPEALRGGPYYVVGLARSNLGDHEQAAIALMHVPILYPQQASLAAEALLAAGRSLARDQQNAEAARLFHEVVRDHPKTTAAAEAQQRLEALQKAP
jgi:tetratricopeptide (TPR) repeat protein